MRRKTALLDAGTWRAEVERRQDAPEHNRKFATVTVAKKEDGVYVVVEDQGEGFVWQRYMQVDPSRAGEQHGRGIAQANTMSFDKLRYNERGNQAVAFVSHERRFEW